ncbi:hypothetical protein Anapl_08667 [Anas platyrhynchos]|uniref:Uncharacterized protein n=1 Tax=Anas platyrhynchos TaxID=8839 RepID=R0LB89_ANAPL|nr:hypothetical protein Anapl_08667 [Anas platyrhynchos]
MGSMFGSLTKALNPQQIDSPKVFQSVCCASTLLDRCACQQQKEMEREEWRKKGNEKNASYTYGDTDSGSTCQRIPPTEKQSFLVAGEVKNEKPSSPKLSSNSRSALPLESTKQPRELSGERALTRVKASCRCQENSEGDLEELHATLHIVIY